MQRMWFALGVVLLQFAMFYVRRALSKMPNREVREHQFGAALITGASSGIGRAVAVYLARAGYKKLVLVSRRMSELEVTRRKVFDELGSEDCLVECIALDLGVKGSADALFEQMADQRFGILFHGAGITHRVPELAEELPREENEGIIGLHTAGCVEFWTAALRKIKHCEKKPVCIQMASGIGLVATPLNSVYAATKAFQVHYMKTIQAENPDIQFIAACPMWVSTPMTLTEKETLMFISPRKFAQQLFSAHWGSKVVQTPYFWHRFIIRLLLALPERVSARLQLKQMTETRGAIIRKLAKIEAAKQQ